MRKTRLTQAQLLALIEQVYAAAEDGGLWHPLLMSIAEAVAGTSACLLSHDLVATGSAVVMAGLHPDVMPLYNAHYHKLDAWALAPGTPWLAKQYPTLQDEAVMPRRELQKTEFYDYVRKYEVSRMMHTTLHVAGATSQGLSVYRTEADPAFGDRETQFLHALNPHLRRALRLHDVFARAAHERQVALDALDAASQAILLATGEGRVVHANRAARTILERSDGLCLDRSLLMAATPAVTSSLRRLCAECAHTTNGEGLSPGGALALPRPSGGRHLQVLVCPVKRIEPLGVGADRVAAVVFVSDPDCDVRPNRELLQVFYGLTPTEADIAARLAAGQSLEDIADECGYTKETLRWYSKQILGKTGCRTRSALVRQLSVTLSSLAIGDTRRTDS